MSGDGYVYRERAGSGASAPLLFLLHGTGGDEDQLFGLGGLRRHVGGRCGSRGAGRFTPGARRRRHDDRHDLASIGRDHRILVQIVEFLACRRANTLGSELGFGHVWNPGIS